MNLGTIALHFTATLFLWGSELPALDNGIYLLQESGSESSIRLPGGSAGKIARKLTEKEFSLNVQSLSNWNDEFAVLLSPSSGLVTEIRPIALAIDGKLYTPVGYRREQLKWLFSYLSGIGIRLGAY